MKKYLLLFFVSISFVFGVERPKFEDFAACFVKNKASVLVYEGLQAFALSENLLAVLPANGKKLNRYVKYDPFLNLYLVRTDFSLFPTKRYDEQNLTRNDWVGIIDDKTPYIGHLKYLAQNLDERDQLDFATKVGQLNTPCCSMLGISLSDGSFIGNRYLDHFAKYNDVYWGDVGVDFAFRDNKIYVQNVRKSGQFLVNDEVVSLDGEAANDLRKLNEKILFADRGATLYFRVLRDNQDLNISTEVFNKDLSTLSSSARAMSAALDPNVRQRQAAAAAARALFTSNLGLSVNRALNIVRVEPRSKASTAGFLVGDKILRVNNQIINSQDDLQRAFNANNELNILISRASKNLPIQEQNSNPIGDGMFQFFIRLTK
ncbi:peptide-binding protein [Campylobacter sp. MIT 12-5580]|uniref:PDZ domain-containing protein n=1 Tax=Campylobacter sp. MIT 12-5580 TaxID=2040651 RepID=UPI0010F5FB55|nr:PDZ domain-containing protein [Campylobacter sp. MIT 12-5580]TKX29564.1 peptide-binding protein [Campylobacter sp. MIT 12-5580]